MLICPIRFSVGHITRHYNDSIGIGDDTWWDVIDSTSGNVLSERELVLDDEFLRDYLKGMFTLLEHAQERPEFMPIVTFGTDDKDV